MTTQDEQWAEAREVIDDTDYGLDEDETGEDHGKGTYDCLEEPDQEPEAVESDGVELEW